MRRKIRIFLLLLCLIYVISPFDLPGPIDDLLFALFTALLEWVLKPRPKKKEPNSEVEEGEIVS